MDLDKRYLEIVLTLAALLFIGERLWNHFWPTLGYVIMGACFMDLLIGFIGWQERQRAKDAAKEAACPGMDWTTFPPSWRAKYKAAHK
jgi:hypothetical protein